MDIKAKPKLLSKNTETKNKKKSGTTVYYNKKKGTDSKIVKGF